MLAHQLCVEEGRGDSWEVSQSIDNKKNSKALLWSFFCDPPGVCLDATPLSPQSQIFPRNPNKY